MKLLITGGCGFIGSAVVRHLIATTDWQIANIDKLTYAGNLESLAEARASNRHHHYRTDICDRPAIDAILAETRPAAILHLAAESHVDRSIDGAAPFIQTNFVGTFTMLEAATAYWRTLDEADRKAFRFQHISTDEVFGSLGATGKFTETTPYAPNSPYSASKASSDFLVRAYHHTYGLDNQRLERDASPAAIADQSLHRAAIAGAFKARNQLTRTHLLEFVERQRHRRVHQPADLQTIRGHVDFRMSVVTVTISASFIPSLNISLGCEMRIQLISLM